MTIEERDRLVREYMPYIRRLANRMIRAGQRPTVERDELVAVGNYSLVLDLAWGRTKLTHILCNAKQRMKRSIRGEVRHWRKRKPWREMFDENHREKF